MASELIQWPKAKYWEKAWNPIIGCKPCSPACENCYAAAMAKRFGGSFEPHYSSQAKPPRSGVVFCGNMTDLFGEWLPSFMGMDKFLLDATEPRNSKATYLWLTKRLERMCDEISGLPTVLDVATLSNHHFGFTAENQEWYEKRLQLRSASGFVWPEWANLWVSCEPLLGPIDLGLMFGNEVVKPKYSWLVVGCESGGKRRPCKIEWVESIVEQCRKAGVPVFVKQLCLPDGKFTNKIEEFPEHLRIRQVPWAGKGAAK